MIPTSKPHRQKLPVVSTPEETRLNTWLQLIRTVTLIEREIVSILSQYDLTLPQFDVLATLRFRDGVTQQELAGRLLVTKGNVCGLVNRLEDTGWVERRPDPADSRANRIHLTPSGRRKIDTTTPAHNDRILSMLAPLRNSEVRLMHDVLTKLENNLSDAGT